MNKGRIIGIGKKRATCEHCEATMHPKSLWRHKKKFHTSLPAFPSDPAASIPTVVSGTDQMTAIIVSEDMRSQSNTAPNATEVGLQSVEDRVVLKAALVQASAMKKTSRAVIAMAKDLNESEALQFKTLIRRRLCQFHQGKEASLRIQVSSLLLTLQRVMALSHFTSSDESGMISGFDAAIPSYLEQRLRNIASIPCVDRYLEELKMQDPSSHTIVNELKKFRWIVTNLILFRTDSKVSETRNVIDYLRQLSSKASQAIQTPCIETLEIQGQWKSMKSLRLSVVTFYKSNVEPHLHLDVPPSKQFLSDFETALFMYMVAFSRPQRTSIYQEMSCENLDNESGNYVYSTTQFKTSKTYKLLVFRLGSEASRLMKLWIEKYRIYYMGSKSDLIFKKEIKSMARVLSTSVSEIRRIYRSEVELVLKGSERLDILDCADGHLQSTVRKSYIHTSLRARFDLSSEADRIYCEVFQSEEVDFD